MWTERRSGKLHQRGSQDHRDPFERDRTRVIHCPAFRRLQRKTQILGTGEGDFHRTRLTHSLEVASIGCALVRNIVINQHDNSMLNFLPKDDLISVICLLHDIGHPPFGHGGEVALNYMMHDFGGFEGNAQTLRLLTKVEESYGSNGLDLTRRSLLGILKYPASFSKLLAKELPDPISETKKPIRINDWLPPKGYYDSEEDVVAWILKPFQEKDRELFQSIIRGNSNKKHGRTKYHSLDCSIMDIADDISYGVHDLEDAIHLRLISRYNFDTTKLRQLLKDTRLFDTGENFLDLLFSKELAERKEAIGKIVNYFVTSVEIKPVNHDFIDGLFKYNFFLLPEARSLLDYFMDTIYKDVIDSQEARIFEYGGQTVVQRLFEAFISNPENLLDIKNRDLYRNASDKKSANRIISDYIANMTDEYAYRMHERLFGFNTRTIFERI
ncbi:MAG: dGTPase [Legionellales bacterium RIFCSPHIGHO2_12_FULL_35_11]|nr:MAG: dGTPase [Legionellales bacterium RIFCSPHIGHO2_12_FULL_35_11]